MSIELQTFKVGDEVYCPKYTNKIIKLISTPSLNPAYSLMSYDHGSYTVEGLNSKNDLVPSIFHATPENKALLEALYKCEFESPKLKGSDLTRKLLSEGKHVLCYVSMDSDKSAAERTAVLVISSYNMTPDGANRNSFKSVSGTYWKYAVPCNDYANLVDGVLEVNK